MNWYLQSGKESDVVTSTRIRFARNLPEFKFNLKNKNKRECICNRIWAKIFRTKRHGRHYKNEFS